MRVRLEPRQMIRHAAIAFGINTLIAVFLALGSGQRTFWPQFIYSQTIGLTTWALIDFGRFVVRRDPNSGWPAGWRAVALPAFGVVVGNVMGTVMGDLLTGHDSWPLADHTPQALAGHVAFFGGIGAAVSYFFWVTGRARRLAEVAAASRRDAAEAQLRLLQSQLAPHMLFNTLANLRVLIDADPARAQAMLDHLIAFLRATLSASRATEHRLAAEFDRTADYLALMQVRMGPRLVPALDLPRELADVVVPTLILQPLVENAIHHGLEPHVAGGRLAVTARRDGRDLVLQVRDTGAGLDPAAPGGTRFGLAHVRDRLATRYGNRASLSLAPAPDADGGALATVRLPLETSPA